MKSALVLLLACLATAAMVARVAVAQPALRALLIVEEAHDDALDELTARLRGELTAAGFEVSSSTTSAGTAPRNALAAAPADMLAVILVRGELHSAHGVELWISDRVLGGTSNARLRSDHPDRSERARRISVEAVELLNARLAELLLHQDDPPAQRPSVQPRAPAPEVGRARWRPALSPLLAAGLGLLVQTDPSVPRLMPSVSVGAAAHQPGRHDGLQLSLSATLAGFGQSIRHEREQGAARVRQGVGLLDAALGYGFKERVVPELSIQAGVYGVGIRGRGVPPFEGTRHRDFSAVLGAALGVRIRVLSSSWLRASLGLLRAFDRSSVFIVDSAVAQVGGLMVLSRLELVYAPW